MDPSVLASLIGAGQNSLQQILGFVDGHINRNFQRREAEKNRDWQSGEAGLQRDWSSQEAERARDWQEEMYAKYNSLAGKVAQAEQAGINPLFAVTGNAVSPMPANAYNPSGASAGSVGTPVGSSARLMGAIDIMSSILNAQRTKQDVATSKALEQKYSAEAKNIETQTDWLPILNGVSVDEARQRIEESVARVLNTDADTSKKTLELEQIGATIANTNADTDVKVQQLALMFSEISKNAKSEKLMDAQMGNLLANNLHLKAQYNKIVQDYGHDKVMNAMTEVATGRSLGTGEDSNGYYRTMSEIKRFLDSVLGWFSASAVLSKNSN